MCVSSHMQVGQPGMWGSSEHQQRDLLRVERMFLDIQRARQELEARDALSKVQASWREPLPPVPSDDPTSL